jgi:rod shape-determining protein MreC
VRLRESLGRYSTALTLVVIVVACLVSLAVNTDSFSVRPKEVGQSFVGIAQRGLSAVGGFFSRTVTSVRELRDLRRQYDALVEQLRETERIARDVSALASENDRLRETLEFSESLDPDNIPARVVAKEPGSFFSGLTINKGSTAGVRRDMPVITNQNGVQCLVGRITEVGLATAVVMPLFDSRSYVAARLDRSRHEGLVSGLGVETDRLSMDYVSETARPNIATGDVVITSGMRSIYPEGIQIGTVQAIRGEAFESSLRIELAPIADFSRLEYVFVLEATD